MAELLSVSATAVYQCVARLPFETELAEAGADLLVTIANVFSINRSQQIGEKDFVPGINQFISHPDISNLYQLLTSGESGLNLDSMSILFYAICSLVVSAKHQLLCQQV
jgi:hypothetical protein